MSDPSRESSPPISRETAGAVMRASGRAAALVHQEMKGGVDSLATIASLAPWVGLFGTIVGIVNSFVGCAGEKSTCMAAVADRLSGSFWPTALGLLVGLTSLWFYRYLTGRVAVIEREMESASLDLVNQLGRFRGRWQFAPTTEPDSRPMFGALSPVELAREDKFWKRSMILTGVALFLAWYIETVQYFTHWELPLASVRWSAFKYVVFVFCASCIPARVLWPLILRRRRGGLVALASVLCLCWCVAEIVLQL